MLLVNGCHISTHAASIRFRCVAFSCVRKNSSSVSCLRSCPNHKGSPVSKLLTTVMNFICLPSRSHPHPFVLTGPCDAWHSSAADTAGRSLAPCWLPVGTAWRLVVPMRFHTPTPPLLQNAY